MNIIQQATNIELTDSISSYVDKKIGSLKKYLEPAHREFCLVETEVGRSTNHHKNGEVFHAEAHLTGPGIDLYAAHDTEDLYTAIDMVEDELARELLSKKGKRERMLRKGGRAIKNIVRGFSFKKGEH